VLDGRLLLLGLHGAPCVAVVDPRPVNWFDPDPRSVSRGEIACYECIEKIDMDIIIVVIPSTRLFNPFPTLPYLRYGRVWRGAALAMRGPGDRS
jgi:hypothetical protein